MAAGTVVRYIAFGFRPEAQPKRFANAHRLNWRPLHLIIEISGSWHMLSKFERSKEK